MFSFTRQRSVKPFLLGPGLSSATWLFIVLALVLAAWTALALECPSQKSGLSPPNPSLQNVVDPNPLKGDIELPMPCGGKLILRPVCVPAGGFFEDLQLYLGCEDCGRRNQGFMEGKRKDVVSGPFTLQDLPEPWRLQLTTLAEKGDGQCPNPYDRTTMSFYYFIGKYEVSNFQWKAIMDGNCPGSDEPPMADDARPKTGISWFEAVDFTRRYTEWLLNKSPDLLPKFSRGRLSYLRLPTEVEWEYAARGGHRVSESQLNNEEFFPLRGRSFTDYAVFTDTEAARLPEKMAWIGSKCPNPLGLFDTAGNAAEMVLDPFRFSVGSRLHGTAGGFIVKGGSYRKRKSEIMPGRREEMPFFLASGAYRSTDLGFRVVLSGIITPDHRNRALIGQWAITGGQSPKIQTESWSPESMPEIDQSKDPVSEIERLATVTRSETKKKNLLFIRDLIKQNNIMLANQKAETVKAIIWGAILTAESAWNYVMRRKVVLQELRELKKIKMETVPESVLDSLDGKIAKALGTVNLYDSAIDYFLKSYIDRIQECQKYPEKVLESQLGLIFQKLSLGENFNHSLKLRLSLFKKHVSLSWGQAEKISQEKILKDIILTYAH